MTGSIEPTPRFVIGNDIGGLAGIFIQDTTRDDLTILTNIKDESSAQTIVDAMIAGTS